MQLSESASPISNRGIPAAVLPVEIIEFIIDEVAGHGELASLCNFSLVCRSFLQRSRYYILRHIRITSLQSLFAFIDFLESQPIQKSLVHSVTLSPANSEATIDLAILQATSLGHLIKGLQNLTELKAIMRSTSFENVHGLSFHPYFLASMHRSATRIRSLHITSLTFYTPHTLASYVSSFTQLRELHCREIRFSKGQTLQQVLKRPPLKRLPRVHELYVRLWYATIYYHAHLFWVLPAQ